MTFGDVEDRDEPLSILVHGFPDTPLTFRYLGPQLASAGYRVVAPWLPGYGAPATGPISTGTYVKAILALREQFAGDERCLLVGHDWGAMAAYGAVAVAPEAFDRLVTLAVPPPAAISDAFGYAQLRRSFYIWLAQQVGLAELAMLKEGFWEGLWADWSPGYDASANIALLRSHVTAETMSGVIAPYRAQFNPEFADPDATAEAAATLADPEIPTLYLHGADDGALGADLLVDVIAHLTASGSDHEIVENAGHFLHLERPDYIWSRIQTWLLDSSAARQSGVSAQAGGR